MRDLQGGAYSKNLILFEGVGYLKVFLALFGFIWCNFLKNIVFLKDLMRK